MITLAIALAVVLACLAVALTPGRDAKALRKRVLAAQGQVPRPADRRSDALVIRSQRSATHPMLARVAALLGHRPELASANTLGWPLIGMLASLLGGFCLWRVGVYIGAFAVLPGALCFVMTTRWLFEWQRRRYRMQMFGQIPDAIGLIIRAVCAGVPIAEALRSVAREMPEPTRSEFSRVVGDIAIGRATDQAIWQLYDRTMLTEYSYLAVTLGLQAQTGGRLAETLENLADMVRKRIAMAKRGRALAAEARMSTTILVGLPFVSGAALAVVRPGYLDVFFTETRGFNLFMLACGLLLAGLLTIRWLTNKSLSV